MKSTGSDYLVHMDNGEQHTCRLKGSFRIHGIKNTNPIAVGDRIELELMEDGVGLITEILDRKNYIIRRSTKLSKQFHVIASNIDRAFLIATIGQPRTSTGFIDRFLLTAEAYGIPATIVFNKIDNYKNEDFAILKELVNTYDPIGYNCIRVSALSGEGVDILEKALHENMNLFAGHSGVGKSTLINRLIPGLELRTKELSETHNKGLHTTTFAEMHYLPNDKGAIIDTPGLKEFGIVDIKKNELGHFFPEIRSKMNECKFNSCLHINEPGCAVIESIETGDIAISRYETYYGIMMGDELKEEYK